MLIYGLYLRGDLCFDWLNINRRAFTLYGGNLGGNAYGLQRPSQKRKPEFPTGRDSKTQIVRGSRNVPACGALHFYFLSNPPSPKGERRPPFILLGEIPPLNFPQFFYLPHISSMKKSFLGNGRIMKIKGIPPKSLHFLSGFL